MPDHTMPRRKAQAKAYDDLAISRAISAVDDPKLQAFLEAVADVVTAISGNQQIKNIEQRDALAAEIAAERKHVYETMRDVRYQIAEGNRARKANADQVAEGLQLILREQESAKQGQALLAANFSTLAENMSDLVEAVNDHDTTLKRHEQIIQSFAESRDASIRERAELRQNQAGMSASLARIETILEDALTADEKRALRRLLAGDGD